MRLLARLLPCTAVLLVTCLLAGGGNRLPVAAQTLPAAAPYPGCEVQRLPAEAVGLLTGTETAFTSDCYLVTVPEDHFGPAGGRTIGIAAVKVHALSATPEPDPILILSGGPGMAIVADAEVDTAALLASEIQNRDIIFIDQRGVGQSQPALHCAEVDDFAAQYVLGSSVSDEAYMAAFFDAGGRCLRRHAAAGVNLSVFNSTQSAADIVDVGRALGYARVYLYGISYGSHLGLTVLRDYNAGGYIRSAVLGGIDDPETNILTFGSNLQERLARVFDACGSDDACNRAYPDLRTTFYNLLASLKANPRQIPYIDEVTGVNASVTVNDITLINAVFGLLAVTPTIPAVPGAIAAAAAGDPATLLFGIAFILSEYRGMDWGKNLAVQCSEVFQLITPREKDVAESEVAPAFHNWHLRFPESSPLMLDFCASTGIPARPASERLPVTTTVPALVINGIWDSFTPPASGFRVATRLGNVYAYTVPIAGHDSAAAPDPCVQGIVSAFLQNPSRPPDGGCLASLRVGWILPE